MTGREGGADVLGHPRASDAAVAELKEPRLRCDRRLVVAVVPSADEEEDEEAELAQLAGLSPRRRCDDDRCIILLLSIV